jgi:cation diffusion facilitator family transporter
MRKTTDIQWVHSHDFSIDSHEQAKKVKAVFILTTVVMLLEITAGTWSGSMALLADGWHMGTHSAAFAITIFAYSYTKKHANNKTFSFGTGKVNYLGGFASAIALAIVALMMAIESVQRLIEPQVIHFNEAIAVAVIGLIVNIISVLVLGNGHHDHHGNADHNDYHDHNMRAAYLHVLADMLTSVLAIFALLAGKLYGLIWVDAFMGIVGSLIIARWSYGLIKDSSEILLDKSANKILTENIVEILKEDNEAIVQDLHIWKIAPAYHAVILSIAAKEPLEPNEYKKILKSCLPVRSHVSIEVNKL